MSSGFVAGILISSIAVVLSIAAIVGVAIYIFKENKSYQKLKSKLTP